VKEYPMYSRGLHGSSLMEEKITYDGEKARRTQLDEKEKRERGGRS